MYRIFGSLLGLLLLIAAGLKAHGIVAGPVAQIGIFGAAWFQSTLIIAEVLLGLWLLSDKYRAGGWLATIFAFLLFAIVSFRAVWLGQSSCGCLGVVEVNPWYSLALDIGVVTLLLIFRRNDQRAARMQR